MHVPDFPIIHGVDFSGARLAGRFIWIARLERVRKRVQPYRLVELSRLAALCGTAERGPALDFLVRQIADSSGALWGLDFPFGLPVEVMAAGATWHDQFAFLAEWGDDAYGAGVECVRRSLARGGPMHIRRLTDAERRAPFDCYHYRIIYQTFFGMRDVVGRLRDIPRTAVLPFQYRRLPKAERVVVEACPSTALKWLGLPHQNYKQPAGGPLSRKRRLTRHAILAGLSRHVRITDTQYLRIMRDGGADALDAVIAAVGLALTWSQTDHPAVSRNPRYAREGRLYV